MEQSTLLSQTHGSLKEISRYSIHQVCNPSLTYVGSDPFNEHGRKSKFSRNREQEFMPYMITVIDKDNLIAIPFFPLLKMEWMTPE